MLTLESGRPSKTGVLNPILSCYAERMTEKSKQTPDGIEELPDAWERFERAFDTVMKAPRKPPAKAPPEPSSERGGKRDEKGSA